MPVSDKSVSLRLFCTKMLKGGCLLNDFLFPRFLLACLYLVRSFLLAFVLPLALLFQNPGAARDQPSAWTTLVQRCRLALNGVCVHEEKPSPSSYCFACSLVKSYCGGRMCENPCLLSTRGLCACDVCFAGDFSVYQIWTCVWRGEQTNSRCFLHRDSDHVVGKNSLAEGLFVVFTLFCARGRVLSVPVTFFVRLVLEPRACMRSLPGLLNSACRPFRCAERWDGYEPCCSHQSVAGCGISVFCSSHFALLLSHEVVGGCGSWRRSM